MIARVAIAETGREVEVAIDDRESFVARLEKAIADGDTLIWMDDTKGNAIGIPVAKIAFIELVDDGGPSVGFSR